MDCTQIKSCKTFRLLVYCMCSFVLLCNFTFENRTEATLQRSQNHRILTEKTTKGSNPLIIDFLRFILQVNTIEIVCQTFYYSFKFHSCVGGRSKSQKGPCITVLVILYICLLFIMCIIKIVSKL